MFIRKGFPPKDFIWKKRGLNPSWAATIFLGETLKATYGISKPRTITFCLSKLVWLTTQKGTMFHLIAWGASLFERIRLPRLCPTALGSKGARVFYNLVILFLLTQHQPPTFIHRETGVGERPIPESEQIPMMATQQSGPILLYPGGTFVQTAGTGTLPNIKDAGIEGHFPEYNIEAGNPVSNPDVYATFTVSASCYRYGDVYSRRTFRDDGLCPASVTERPTVSLLSTASSERGKPCRLGNSICSISRLL